MRKATCTALILMCSLSIWAQDRTKSRFGKGIRIVAKDSSFSMKFSVRIQTLYDGRLNLANDNYENQFLIRRARLKFDGFAYSPKLNYKIELGLASSDIGGGDIPQSNNVARIILDAVLKWNFLPRWTLWVGQTKLPGNRERVISSQKLQFVNRSNVNSAFNLDRDLGIQLHYSLPKIKLIGSVSMGEGRAITTKSAGGNYDYTLRAEYLPFGVFMKKGDYVSASIYRELTPKLAVGVTYDYNNKAMREGGQLGAFLPAQRDLETWIVDAHFKYKGLSSLVEFVSKRVPNGSSAIVDENNQFTAAFLTGTGISMQVGYIFKNNIEVAGRYTQVSPERDTQRYKNVQYTLGISKYIVGHSLKVQSDVTLIQEDTKADMLMIRAQVELSF